jgi:hypothetical protein
VRKVLSLRSSFLSPSLSLARSNSDDPNSTREREITKKTSTNRHLTAYKRYQVISRHCRDALRYGSVKSYSRVIQAVERKLDQYEDESPTLPDLEADEQGNLPRPPGPVEAFFTAMTEVPE